MLEPLPGGCCGGCERGSLRPGVPLPLPEMGGVVGAPPRLEEELLLLAASTLEAAHMSNMVELEAETLSPALLLSLEVVEVVEASLTRLLSPLTTADC